MLELNAIRLVQRKDGKPDTLYLTAMTAEMLRDRAKVHDYHAGESPDGYQRKPTESRYREIARYVLDNEGLLPTSLLVNVRGNDASEDGVTFEPDGVGEGAATGTLKIPDGVTLWIVDGQHRLYGLVEASNRIRHADPEATLGYDIPVVFTLGSSRDEEMDLFYVVNSKARSVPTDLAADLIRQRVIGEGKGFVHRGKGTQKEFRKAVGVTVARHLNSSPGPWQAKIRLPNETANRKLKPLQLNAIASSLEPALRDTYLKTIYEPETDREWPTLCGLVHTYWAALSELMPEAFNDIAGYSVQRTTGTYAFNHIFPDVLYRCRDKGDFSVNGFKEVLSALGKWVDGSTWHLENGDPLTQSTGMKSIRHLIDLIRKDLPPVEMPGLSLDAADVGDLDQAAKA